MVRSKKPDSYATHVAASLGPALAERGVTQADLAARLAVTPAYVSNVTNGRKPASARWADLVADVLEMTKDERRDLHVAAAKDAGFKL